MISLLVAYTKNKRVIGAQGKIPWKLSSERNRFKKLCTGKYVIMGRKSFDEIGKPLSYCTLVVVSKSIVAPSTGSGTTACSGTTMVVRQESMGAPQNDAGSLSLSKGIKICPSLEAAINFCKACGQDEILVAGGESIYRQALPFATRIYARSRL